MLTFTNGTDLFLAGGAPAQIAEGRWFDTPNGDRACPAHTGWTDGTWTLAAVADADPVPDGQRSTGRDIRMVAGAPKWVHRLEAITTEELAAAARAKRNQLLFETDHHVVRAAETATPVQANMLAYRTALRDVPQQAGFPTAINWPTKP